MNWFWKKGLSTDAIEAYDELSQSIASSETEKVAEILKPSLLTIKNSTLTDEQKTTMFQSIVDYIATNNIEPKTPADRAEFVMAMIFLSNYSSKADDYLENKSWQFYKIVVDNVKSSYYYVQQENRKDK